MTDFTSPGIHTYTIGTTGTYDITADGAQGGAASWYLGGLGGAGAVVSGDVYLQAGAVLEIVVGGEGGSGVGPFTDSTRSGAGGGGGGSFVIETNDGTSSVDTILAVAGGGGGGGANTNGGGGGTSPTGGNGGRGFSNNNGGAGGAHGSAGQGGAFGGGGGGGYTGGSGATPSTSTVAGAGSIAGNTFSGGGGGDVGYEFTGGQGGVGGGGGSYLDSSVTNGSETAGVHSGAGEVTIDALCYLAGTRILTPTGEALIESLKPGDRVVTRFGGLQQIKWIGRQSYRAAVVRQSREHLPVQLRAGSLGDGLPARDLYVSPGHSMLIQDTLVLATSLVNGITITQGECPERIEYFQIELQGHDCVIAEGTWSETYADWEEGRALFHNAAQFHAMFPDHHAPEAPILCAPRPERGAALDAVLRPIVARAARATRDATPGALRGYIDRVRGDWKLDGWAHDESHPELPVLLEILLEGRVIGTVLACDFREDLLAAGFGQGRCSFTFISPIKLRAPMLSTLQVRRAVDGAPVAVSRGILDAAPAPAGIKPRLAIVA